MPDRYENKPTADQLLHDLARVFEIGGLTTGPDTPMGPVERIYGAVEEYKKSPDWDDTPPTSDHISGLQHTEHGAWLAVCDELKALSIDINGEPLLARLMEMWGEHLVNLRCHQTSATRKLAFDRRTENLAAEQGGG